MATGRSPFTSLAVSHTLTQTRQTQVVCGSLSLAVFSPHPPRLFATARLPARLTRGTLFVCTLLSLGWERRLARKAESARQARLRHKQFVTDLQEQAAGLNARIRQLEAHCTTGAGSPAVVVRELKSALPAEQFEQLRKWLQEAQGDNHVLARYENGTPLPQPPASAAATSGGGGGSSGSAPIAIGGGAGASTHWRSGAAQHSISPMESEEGDAGAFPPMSRSWDDCEVARSILNLNSPNGFHPLQGPPNGLPDAFSLSSGAAGSLPPMLPSHKMAMGSMLGSVAHSRKAS